MKAGDLVVIRKGHYKFSFDHAGEWVFTDSLGVITDDRGFVDGTAEYKVYTADGKHLWEHADDLQLAGVEQ